MEDNFMEKSFLIPISRREFAEAAGAAAIVESIEELEELLCGA